MAFHQILRKSLKNQRGVVGVVVAGSLIVLLAFVALAVDIGIMMVARNELQNSADAAALAATRQLGVIYEGIPFDLQWTYICDSTCQTLINSAAISTAASNRVKGLAVAVQPADIVVGRWTGSSLDTSNGMLRPDAVRVYARRDSDPSTGGPIGTSFARVLGINSVAVATPATAALTASSAENYDDLELPVGISEAWAFGCGNDITFYPTKDSCAGWTDFNTKNGTYDPSDKSNSDADLRKLIQDITSGTFPYDGMPEKIMLNNLLPFTGGTLSENTFRAMEDLFNSRKICCNSDGLDYWDTSVVVYRRLGDLPGSCGNPSDVYTIVGFAKIRIIEVIDASGKYLRGELQCGFDNERGGGGPSSYGTLGTIPNLVK